MARNYSGSDLSQEFKNFFKKEKRRIVKVLTEMGCTDIKINYGFYFFSGFFTSKTGQVYYLSSPDVRFGYDRILYRTAKNYKDYTGGGNNYVNVNELKKMCIE